MKRIPKKFIREAETIHRMKLVLPAADRDRVFAALGEQGYSIKFQGPYSNRKMFPTVDVTRCLIYAEKQIS